MMMSLTSAESSSAVASADSNNPYLDKSQCRTCLAAMDIDQHYLFEQVAIGDDMVQTASIIMACASVQILVNDYYPQYICRTCLGDAINSYAFRSKCELSQQRLLEASHVGTLKVETTTHLPTLQPQPFKIETVDSYEADNDRQDDTDDDDYIPGASFGGEVSSDDEVLAKKVGKRTSPRISTAPLTRKRKSTTNATLPQQPSLAATPHFCRQCDASFPTRLAFIAHRDTHASFICRWCVGGAVKVAFASYETLLAHMRKKHKDEYQKQGEALGDGAATTKVEEEQEEIEEEVVAKKKRKVVVIKMKKTVKKTKKSVDNDVVKLEADHDDDNEALDLDTDPNTSQTATPYQCHFCYKYFSDSARLTSHFSRCSSSADVAAEILPNAVTGKFTCHVCSRHFRSYRAVTEHKRSHKGGVFCPYCGLHMLARSMVNHRKREHGASVDVPCEGCHGVYKGVDELENHLISHKNFSCSDCSYSAKYIDDFRLHLLSHELKKFAENENGRCRECNKQAADTLALIQHYKTHSIVTCQECETNYGNMVHLNQHTIKAHSDIDTTISEEKRKCTVCAKVFLTVEGMWQHRAKHNAETGKDGETTGELFCAYCDFRPKSNVSLGKHMQEEHHTQKTETCSVCDKSFFSAGKLKVHMLTHNADKQHVCEVCGAGFALKGNLNVHMRVHTGEKPYKCEICDRIKNTEEDLQNHKKTHEIIVLCNDSEVEYRCHSCGEDFENELRLQDHMQIHDQLSEHECNLCHKICRSFDSLRRHLFWHGRQATTGIRRTFVLKNQIVFHCRLPNGTEAFMCKACDLIYSTKKEIKEHIFGEAHTNHYAFQCDICKKYFECKDRLRQHINNMHDNAIRMGKKRICSVCGLALASPRNLLLHMRIHTGEKPYKCEFCDFRCTQSSGLKIHNQTHNPVPVDTCATCGKSFNYRSGFLVHMRTAHTNTRPFACTQCNKRFKEKTTRREHEKTHAAIRTHVCSYCGKAFLRRSQLTIHMKIHTGERPHECSVCGKRFLQKHVRDSHMKTHGLHT